LVTIRKLVHSLPLGAFLIVAGAAAVVLLQPGTAESQFRGGGGFDPNRMFDFMAQGKDFLDMNDIQRMASRDPSAPERWQRFMQDQGITNGRVTRDQFALYMQMRMAERAQSGGPGGPGGFQRPGDSSTPNSPPTMGGNQPSGYDPAREE